MAKRVVTFETVVELGLRLPGVEEATSYGTPALKVRGRFLCRLKEDGVTLALSCDFEQREQLLANEPATFFMTDHYLNYPVVLVRLPRVRREQLRALLADAWRRQAGPKPAGARGAARSSRRPRPTGRT
jgi:hypothetical protein